jgi:hypothetical protein
VSLHREQEDGLATVNLDDALGSNRATVGVLERTLVETKAANEAERILQFEPQCWELPTGPDRRWGFQRLNSMDNR